MEPSLTAVAQPMQVHRTPEVLAVLMAAGVRLTEVAAQPTAAVVVVNLMAADTTNGFVRPRTTEAAKPDSFAAFFFCKEDQCSCSGITAY
jgi:hypothetical protein